MIASDRERKDVVKEQKKYDRIHVYSHYLQYTIVIAVIIFYLVYGIDTYLYQKSNPSISVSESTVNSYPTPGFIICSNNQTFEDYSIYSDNNPISEYTVLNDESLWNKTSDKWQVIEGNRFYYYGNDSYADDNCICILPPSNAEGYSFYFEFGYNSDDALQIDKQIKNETGAAIPKLFSQGYTYSVYYNIFHLDQLSKFLTLYDFSVFDAALYLGSSYVYASPNSYSEVKLQLTTYTTINGITTNNYDLNFLGTLIDTVQMKNQVIIYVFGECGLTKKTTKKKKNINESCTVTASTETISYSTADILSNMGGAAASAQSGLAILAGLILLGVSLGFF